MITPQVPALTGMTPLGISDQPKHENYLKFESLLAEKYKFLFLTDEYAYSASQTTPEDLAKRMTAGLLRGSASKDGTGIKVTCKAFGIKLTYKAIQAFLKGEII